MTRRIPPPGTKRITGKNLVTGNEGGVQKSLIHAEIIRYTCRNSHIPAQVPRMLLIKSVREESLVGRKTCNNSIAKLMPAPRRATSRAVEKSFLVDGFHSHA